MKLRVSIAALCGAAISALAVPAYADESKDGDRLTAWEASRAPQDDSGMIATGVARARDRLDSATSTSSLLEGDITRIAPTSLSELFRNIPGVRSEAGVGTTNGSYTIRGLPLVSSGAKYLQLQEDGLPVLEFGDFLALTADTFTRADLNVDQIESIRGGSASTFASNAPGGVINLISKTGEVEGGSILASAGLNYEGYRSDFDYGGHLSDTVRFHVGGFYREGNGPRHIGYTADRGGQIKFNVTKDFTGGYIRFYGKVLDDRNAMYLGTPISVTGTNSDPHYHDLTGFSANSDSLLSRYIADSPVMDENNRLTQFNVHDGLHALSKAFGLETKFSIGEWSISEHMRYADQSADASFLFPIAIGPIITAPALAGAPGGSLVYASGPLKGQNITNPTTINGNGIAVLTNPIHIKFRSANNFTNDLRVGRVWNFGGGDLTTTAGLYTSRQEFHSDQAVADALQDVRGDGGSALFDVVKADGKSVTQGGFLDFAGPVGSHVSRDVDYTVIAPYGSVNFHRGKLALGASVRVDTGKVEGTIRANEPTDVQTIDINGDGIISDAERTFAFVPFSRDMPVNYRYHYVSYSFSTNYRWSESLSSFARYSRGARAGAERLLFSPAISRVDGSLLNKKAGYDPVKQAEVGLKYRNNGVFFNLTGFWAKVRETNTQLQPDANGFTTQQLVSRGYRAYGGEIEGGIRRGHFNLTGNATVTNAKITAAENPALVGNKPRHQAALIYQIMPQYDTERFTIGADVIGTTSSYTQDINELKMPAYTTVGAFVQIRPIERVELSFNVNNLFDVKALTDVSAASMPANGVTLAQTLYGRTISTALRFYF
ncbi:TonB-dependent receptor domain-containing protein [Novosphingobium sp.]|uniref:TonB-dependent receptor domain-containing protein n=1 Tax=Novosphingobium sp. TaxID=1874826 RepID=UPI002B4A4F70|nr:TonB-dependent receptor [Novosphingobium sp.]HKR91265.1 TonB-dependent receptor [Novosphingobium sp.]